MTVSLALRKSNRIANETRMRVEKEAARQGYNYNPLIGAYMEGVRRGQASGASPLIAYISGATQTNHFRTPHLRQLLQGVSSRARALGFLVQEFFGAGASLPLENLAKELEGLRCAGVVLAPFPPSAPEIILPWERFSCVAVGHSAKRPAMHAVTDEKIKTCRDVLTQLEKAGFSRIGFVSFKDHEELHSHGLVASFIEWQQSVDASKRIPILRPQTIQDHSGLSAWIQKYQPSVVLSPVDLSSELAKMKVPPPAFSGLCMSRSRAAIAHGLGSIEPNNEVGIAAVDMLAGLIYRHETGLPSKPSLVEVPGVLREMKRKKTTHRRA